MQTVSLIWQMRNCSITKTNTVSSIMNNNLSASWFIVSMAGALRAGFKTSNLCLCKTTTTFTLFMSIDLEILASNKLSNY